jgi:hypothetical protein
MGFLDNSGDIILDCVLTDTGRKIMARGDGSFQITKFALGDEEVDYSLYDKTHPSGSSYYDLEILQTPILEAFTDNAASMKTMLQTYDDLELLFLPVLRLNQQDLKNAMRTNGSFYIAVNQETEDNGGSNSTYTGVARRPDGQARQGFLFGESLAGTVIRFDQGLDTTQISPLRKLSAEMQETSYTIQMDNRLGGLVSKTGNLAQPDYIDDDNVAYYTVDLGDEFVTNNEVMTTDPGQVIAGPRGTYVEFRVQSSMDTNTSSYLFTVLGSTQSMDNRDPSGVGTSTVYYIDSIIRATGVKTGTSIDIPVRYVRLQ